MSYCSHYVTSGSKWHQLPSASIAHSNIPTRESFYKNVIFKKRSHWGSKCVSMLPLRVELLWRPWREKTCFRAEPSRVRVVTLRGQKRSARALLMQPERGTNLSWKHIVFNEGRTVMYQQLKSVMFIWCTMTKYNVKYIDLRPLKTGCCLSPMQFCLLPV